MVSGQIKGHIITLLEPKCQLFKTLVRSKEFDDRG